MKSIIILLLLLLTFPCAAAETGNRNVILRGSYSNSQSQFNSRKTGRVAFMGGSITQMNGYRPMVASRLQKLYPGTKFEFINAGISSTCSTTGAFRLRSQVLEKGKIDLFFIEFAVNDDQDAGHAHRECVRGMEGIIRQVRRAQPQPSMAGIGAMFTLVFGVLIHQEECQVFGFMTPMVPLLGSRRFPAGKCNVVTSTM
ncbi:MAG: GDSL-type esterase/lipase family protein [Verrucomicrobiales bacterium]